MHTRRKPPRFALNTVFAATLACYAPLAQANPAGADVVAGSAQLQQQGNSLVISNTPGTIINWQSFSIQPHELTRFVQQSAQSAVLNRVVGQDPSQILGQLQSNGQVFLINPNGVVFGQGAQVDVAGLLASTLNLSDADFQAGKLRLSGTTTASVSNAASISTPSGGFVYLIAPNVHNHGVIVSPQGEVLLAAGQSVELVDGVDTSLRVKIAAPAGEVLNVGQLIASQGRIGIFATAIQQQGLVSANRAELGEGGRIVFKASRDVQLAGASLTEARGGGSVVVDAGLRADVLGQIDVAHQTGKGGQITVLGEQVKVDGQLDASGASGGGTILLGGDYQGKNAAIRNAQFTELGSQARLDASAGQQGDGGKIIVWADQDTEAHGQISARGGVLGGNGGFAEVSGKRHLQFQTAVDLSAPKGQIGKLLLDPTDIIIDSTNVAALFGASADVTLAATQDVIFDASAGSAATSFSISVQADRDISLQSGTSLTSTSGNINLNAGRDVLAQGAISANGDLLIRAGRDVQNEADFTAAGLLQIQAGNDIVQNAMFTGNGNTINLFANDSALCTAYGCVGTLTLNHDVSTFGLIDLAGKGITQLGGVLNAGSGTVRFNAGTSGIGQSNEASLVADTLTINAAGDVSLLNVRAGSSAVMLQASLADATDKQLNVRVQNTDLRIDGSGIRWSGTAALAVSNGNIIQNSTEGLGKILVKQLDLAVNNETGSGGEVSLLGVENQIGQLSAQLVCATGSCSSASLDVRNSGDLLIGRTGIRHEYGDVVLGSSGKIHLDNAGIETGNSGSSIYLYSTAGTLTGSGANAVLRSDLINLQRDVGGNGYAGAIGAAAPGESLRLANRSGGEAISLYLGGSGASVAGVQVVSDDYLNVSTLNLADDQALFLQSVDGLNLQNVGAINTGKADLSLHALGGELLLTSYSSMAGKNISLKSSGNLLLDNLTIDAIETVSAEARALSSQWVEGTMSINAGSAISLAADNINLAVSAPIQAPKVSIQTLNAGVSLNLGGSDNEGVLGLSLDDLSGISTDLLALRAVGGSDGLIVSSDFTKTGALSLQAGGGIQLDANLSADQLTLKSDSASIQGAGSVTATGELVLNAVQGIFGADSGLRVSAQTIKASSSLDGQGAIDLETETPAVLDLQTANSQISVTALNGAELTVQQIQAGSGAVSLSTDGSLLATTAGIRIKGGDLALSAASIGSATQRLETDASGRFEIRTRTGSSYISELGGANAHILRSDGSLDVVLGGNVQLDDQSMLGNTSILRLDVGGNLSVLRANALSAGTLNLSSAGTINSNALLQALNGPLQLSAQSVGASSARVALSAATQTVSSTGNGALYLQSNGGSLNLTSQGGLIDLLAQSGNTQLDQLQSQGGAIKVQTLAGDLSLTSVQAGSGSVQLDSSGALSLGSLDSTGAQLKSGGTLSYSGTVNAGSGQLGLTAGGAISSSGGLLKASSISLQAVQGIGAGNALVVESSQLSAHTTGSNAAIALNSQGGSAQLSTQDGDIRLNSSTGSQVSASVGGQGRNLSVQAQSGDLQLQSLSVSGLAQLQALQGSLSGQSGTAWQAGQFDVKAGQLNLNNDLNSSGSLMLDSLGAINAQGGRLTGSQITLRAAGPIGDASALQINTASLDAASSLAGAGIQLSGTAATAKLSSLGGDISWQAQGASQVAANAGSGAIKASSDVALEGSFSAGSVQLSAQRLGSAAQRLQLDTLSVDLQAAGELYADGSQRLASLQVSNSGSLTDFSGSGSYSARITSASTVVLNSAADIGLQSLSAKQVKLTALGSIQGLAGQTKQLQADTASLQAGGDIRLSSQVASLDLKAGANIDLVNDQALILSGASAGRDLRVESFGGLSTTGLVKSGGKLTLLTHSPLQIGSAGLEAGGDLLLQTLSSGGNDEIALNGNLNVLGNCEIQSAGGIQQNAAISTQGGSLLLNAAGGDLLMSAAASSQSNGGAIRYSALGNLTLALLDAGAGSVDLLASRGSIGSSVPGGMNVRAGALNAKAGGGILLRTNVPASKLTLSSGTGVLDVRDASGVPYPGTTPVDESEQIGNESVQAVGLLTALGDPRPSVQDQVEQLLNAVEQDGQENDQTKKARKC